MLMDSHGQENNSSGGGYPSGDGGRFNNPRRDFNDRDRDRRGRDYSQGGRDNRPPKNFDDDRRGGAGYNRDHGRDRGGQMDRRGGGDRDFNRDRDYRGGGGGGGDRRDYRQSYQHRDRDRDYRRRSRSRGRNDYSRRRSPPRKGGRLHEDEEYFGPPPDVLPLNQWPRKLKVWDIPPEGYQNWTAKQAKESGLFASASQAIKSGVDGTAGLLPTGMGGYAGLAQNNPAAQSAFAVKQAKRLFIGELPPKIEDADLAEFFNRLLEDKNGKSGLGRPVVNAQIQSDLTYAFVEFRTPEETSQALQFDGTEFFGSNLKIRRPKEYVPPSGLDILPAFGLDSGSKIFIGDLPTYLAEEQVKELMTSFGELKAFHLAREASGISKGYAFCEYLDPNVTDTAIKNLHGMELGERKLIAERASSIRAKKALISEANLGMSLMMMLATRAEEIEIYPVMLIINAVQGPEMKKDSDYEDICQDVREESEKYGKIINMHIPRPIKGKKVRGIGKIFVEYEKMEDCKNAVETLHGRRFNDRIVVTGYYPREKFYKEFYEPNSSCEEGNPPPPPMETEKDQHREQQEQPPPPLPISE